MLLLALNTAYIKSTNTHINKQKHAGHGLSIVQTTSKAGEEMERKREAAA